jgi:peroxiredoxin
VNASQQSDRGPGRRPPLLFLGGALLLGMMAFGLALWPRPRAAAVELPQDTRARLAKLSDSLRERFALDQPAPDFTLIYADGTALRLSELRGKPVILNFWATWCTPCKAEMPELQALYSASDEGSFELLAINMREAPEPVTAFGAELGLSFPLVIDPAGAIADSYQVTVLPVTIVIDAAGVAREQHLGPLDRTRLRELLAAHS